MSEKICPERKELEIIVKDLCSLQCQKQIFCTDCPEFEKTVDKIMEWNKNGKE
jgi:hypothetical protein